MLGRYILIHLHILQNASQIHLLLFHLDISIRYDNIESFLRGNVPVCSCKANKSQQKQKENGYTFLDHQEENDFEKRFKKLYLFST